MPQPDRRRMERKSSHKRSGIAAWPMDERPRERLLVRGPEALTDAELLVRYHKQHYTT